jgi:NDP-sugar pyrophosphorylase family protein
MKQLEINNLLDLTKTIAKDIFNEVTYPFEVLDNIGDIILKIGKNLSEEEYEKRGEDIWIAKSANILACVHIDGPVIIDKYAEVRHCAFLRGNVIIGKGAVVGNSTELKNVILFDKVQVPHFNYVGDSILGYKSHMGAGAITSNCKSDHTLVTTTCDGEKIQTGRKKFGAVLGDYVEVGCNAVLNPGTVIGRKKDIYPLSSVRGYVAEKSIYKNQNEIVAKY